MKIIGHRGSGGHAPPSSAPAIKKGLELGATAIELEIQFAGDSTPIVFHDRTLERAAGVNGTIRNQDLRELSGYDIGFRFSERFRGERLLTLEDAAELIPNNIDIHADITDFEPVNAKHLRGLLAILKHNGGLERCLFTSISREVLATLGSTDRKVRRGLRTAGARSDSVEQAAALGCSSLHPDAASTRRALVDTCREHGLAIFPHSAHDGRSIRSMVDLEVDGLSTDHPDRLLEIAGSTGPRRRRSPARQSPRHTAEVASIPEEVSTGMETAPDAAGLLEKIPAPPEPPPDDGADSRDEAAAPVAEPASKSAEAPAVESSSRSAGAPAADGQKKPRRRGRRGGRREQARRPRPPSETGAAHAPAPEEAEVIPLEPVEDEGQPLELLGEIYAELDRESAGDPAASGSDNERKRRRRGRRGGKRVQARRKRKSQSGEGSDS